MPHPLAHGTKGAWRNVSTHPFDLGLAIQLPFENAFPSRRSTPAHVAYVNACSSQNVFRGALPLQRVEKITNPLNYSIIHLAEPCLPNTLPPRNQMT
jgi:hypothetical protein